jgi:hypothetical protein
MEDNQAGNMVWIKFNQNIDIAVRAHAFSQIGPKDGQLTNVVSCAEFSDFFIQKVDVRLSHHSTSIIFRLSMPRSYCSMGFLPDLFFLAIRCTSRQFVFRVLLGAASQRERKRPNFGLSRVQKVSYHFLKGL